MRCVVILFQLTCDSSHFEVPITDAAAEFIQPSVSGPNLEHTRDGGHGVSRIFLLEQ
jgi:hypothetical protein